VGDSRRGPSRGPIYLGTLRVVDPSSAAEAGSSAQCVRRASRSVDRGCAGEEATLRLTDAGRSLIGPCDVDVRCSPGGVRGQHGAARKHFYNTAGHQRQGFSQPC
jgi:hypothetical protein